MRWENKKWADKQQIKGDKVHVNRVMALNIQVRCWARDERVCSTKKKRDEGV